MKKGITKKGFTIIEVLLFLAISSAIFVVLISNTSSTVARRRYNDTVNDAVEEIRNAYSATINVETYRDGAGDTSKWCTTVSQTPDKKDIDDNYPGRTRCAVYGQVLTFGENNKTDINRYTIIGKILDKNIEPGDANNNDDVLIALREVGADIVTKKEAGSNQCVGVLAGNSATHFLQWTGRIEQTVGHGLFKGAIMIARSPMSASVHTYILDTSGGETLEVQQWLNNNSSPKSCSYFTPTTYDNTNVSYLTSFPNVFVLRGIANNKWRKDKDIDLCIGSDDTDGTGDHRRAIRIHGDGSTESAVELLSEVDSNNICKDN